MRRPLIALAAALVLLAGGGVASSQTSPAPTEAELYDESRVLAEHAEALAARARAHEQQAAKRTTTTTTVAPTTTTTTTVPPTTTTVPPTTTLPPTTTTTAPPTRFATLPVGSALPSDATCATRVAARQTSEVRPGNATYNATRGRTVPNPERPLYARITGNYVGNTEQILLWGACKWGIDEDIVFAKAVTESFWRMSTNGDNGESWGLMQVRQPYWGWAFPEARTSTAMNVDVALAAQRTCFEGTETWLNSFPRGRQYAAGDMWGCVGMWFTGRWYAPQPGFDNYVNTVLGHVNARTWTTPTFRNAG
jgi:hypothetical protein